MKTQLTNTQKLSAIKEAAQDLLFTLTMVGSVVVLVVSFLK